MGPTTGMILIRHGQTEFNRVYSETRRDPDIRDPQLTAVGRSQAAAIAQALGAMNPSRLIASPYTRALETAERIAADLGVPISVEPLIAERFAFTCDIGSPLATLQARWPDIAFDHLPDPWWPLREGSVEALSRRSKIFCHRIAREAWSRIAVVTHWGFIRAVTGLKVPNGAALRMDPTRPDRKAEPLFLPGTG
jgi:glucosyl-3-phosphoglycerate phosphatase